MCQLLTLGATCHKAIFIDRMGFRALMNINVTRINIATGFVENSANFMIGQHITYIKNIYSVNTTNLSSTVNAKFATIIAHIDLAAGSNARGQLIWSFAAGTAALSPIWLYILLFVGSLPASPTR